jgi:hypothetical protein
LASLWAASLAESFLPAEKEVNKHVSQI